MIQEAELTVTVTEKPGTVTVPFTVDVKSVFTVDIQPPEAETEIGGEARFAIKLTPTPPDHEGLVRMWIRNLPPTWRYEFSENPAPFSAEVSLNIFTRRTGPVGEHKLSLACSEVPSFPVRSPAAT